jgi:cyclopropane fatty-acyl-phospholipid synthase-like methyltransferase
LEFFERIRPGLSTTGDRGATLPITVAGMALESAGLQREFAMSVMAEEDERHPNVRFDFYGPQYARFGSATAAEVRRDVYGEDIGQQNWQTAAERAEVVDLLRIDADSRVLDIACGAGGPSLALVERTGCRLTGLDVEAAGIARAEAQASLRGLTDRATFAVADCGAQLSFEDGSFDALLCIDAILHLGDRLKTFAEWARVLDQGGRVLFTDGAVLTGPVAKSELDIRAAMGSCLFVPPGFNEEAVAAVGLTLVRRDDRTTATAETATKWHAARSRRTTLLVAEEGADWFAQRQLFLATTGELARSRRLSRFLYVAEKPSTAAARTLSALRG